MKANNKGFTIVELLIVFIIIGILAALVITTLSNVQRKARDTERKTDINAIHGHLEAYFTINKFYPKLETQLNDNTWVQTNMKDLDIESLHDPKGATGNNIGPDEMANVYSYNVTPIGCDNITIECTAYILAATLEMGGNHIKASLN